MATSQPTLNGRTDSNNTLDAETAQRLEEKMPASIKGFTASLGRTFECPECGEASNGSCGNCGYTHPRLRNDGSEGGHE